MHPVFLKIPLFGGITIYTYGVMVALGFVAAMFYIAHEARRVGENPARAMDLVFYVILAAIVGSRLMDIAVNDWERFLENPLIIFKIWQGGLIFYGGLIASVAVSVWYVRRHKMSFLVISDIFAPAIALGHSIGRIGCFLVGCCYGRAAGSDAWYAVIFPNDPHSFAPAGVPIYPTQLMESAGEFLIFATLAVLQRRKRFDGQVIGTYFILYALLRLFVEYFRSDVGRGLVIEPWLSVSQLISILILITGLVFYLKLWNKGRKEI